MTYDNEVRAYREIQDTLKYTVRMGYVHLVKGFVRDGIQYYEEGEGDYCTLHGDYYDFPKR